MIFYDTETCGLHGMAVLIQWAEDNGDVQLFCPWENPIQDTLDLIERFMNHEGGVVGFNLAFDHFHLCKLYTVFSEYPDKDEIPMYIIEELAALEKRARDGVCLKPVKACDLMLQARKGPYQSTMDRGDIRIKKVPTAIAYQLATELDKRVNLKDIYFARKKDKTQRWTVQDITDADGELDTNFKDILLKFAPSSALKALAVDMGLVDALSVIRFDDVSIDKFYLPEEYGYAPFAMAVGNPTDWKGAWPEKIKYHIDHWRFHEHAREYAKLDVEYTRKIYERFGYPELGDDDSELACMVGAVRWRGFKIDANAIRALQTEALLRIKNTPTAPAKVRHYITEKLDVTEQLVIGNSTGKVILESISTWRQPCPICNVDADVEVTQKEIDSEIVDEFDAPPMVFESVIKASDPNCQHCGGSGSVLHPAAERAREVLDARMSLKEVELYDKLLLAGRLHASFKVIGTLSSRMSGTDGLNPQGIKKAKPVRSSFPLAWEGMILAGGDFSGFEVTLAEACYNDPDLRKDLLTCEKCEGHMEYMPERNDFICQSCGSNKGKKIHALFGVHVFPDMTYDQIKATEGTKDDRYTRSKQAVFAMFYGGEGPTLQDRLGVDLETANKAFERFAKRYKRVGLERKKIFDMFCSMQQPEGIGSRVEWHTPADYIESMFGFRRYFTLENSICEALFTLANKPPISWKNIKIKVQRRDRLQLASGAAQSALFAAAFALQASNMRAAANHVIQSAGAQITKKVQRRIWDVQPAGIHDWLVQPMNIHDEIMAPCKPEVAELVKKVVDETVESFRPKVPLIKMDWVIGLKSWAEKG